MKTNIRVNNTTHALSVDSRLTLLDALRDVLGLIGTKNGCDQGACGARRSSAFGFPRRMGCSKGMKMRFFLNDLREIWARNGVNSVALVQRQTDNHL